MATATPPCVTPTTASTVSAQRRFTIGLSEILNFAYDSFCSNKLQFTLTALAMAVGTASVILVATIGLTGKQYMLRQLQSIGTNMIYADYQGGLQRIDSTPDPMTVEDVQAVREQVPSVVAASPPSRWVTASAWGRQAERHSRPRRRSRVSAGAQSESSRRTLLRLRRLPGPQQSRRDHRETGAEALRNDSCGRSARSSS